MIISPHAIASIIHHASRFFSGLIVFPVLTLICCAGYYVIIFESFIKVNKAAIALVTGVLCWSVYAIMTPDHHFVIEQLQEQAGSFSGIIFFLLAAMTIIEIIDQHHGFSPVTSLLRTNDRRALLWLISLFTFFLAAVVNNMTAALVMVSLLQKTMRDRKDIILYSGMVVIAANSGGAWSPIGDFTTTMLWIGGHISSGATVTRLFIPSIVSVVIPLVCLTFFLKGSVNPLSGPDNKTPVRVRGEKLVFIIGTGSLLLIPVFETVTHLPPYLGALLGLGIIWIATELLNVNSNGMKTGLRVSDALRKIDLQSILFFLGILCTVAALQSAGILARAAHCLNAAIPSHTVSIMLIGLISAIIDNVPLVAAVMGMYNLSVFPPDSSFWMFLSFCTGTGGSVLVIGSAAGIVAMGIANISFGEYLRKTTPLALVSYFSGIFTYLLFFSN